MMGENTERTMCAMEIKYWNIDKVLPYSSNPRIISETAVRAVADSLREFGFRQPLVVDEEGVLIVGHTRLRAAKSLGLGQVPVHQVLDWSEDRKRAYRLADNKTGELAQWDFDLLQQELDAITTMDIGLDTTGFMPDERLEIAELSSVTELEPHESSSASITTTSRPTQIRVALYVKQVNIFETAMKKTGLQNRAEAWTKICEEYLAND